MSVMSDTFTVKLPAEMKRSLTAEAKKRGFDSVADYLTSLARANAPIDLRADPALEAALLEGVRSEALVADDAFWKSLRRRVRKTTRARKRSA